MQSAKGQRDKGKGQVTVEFALVLIVLLAMVYGIIEISRLLFINAEIQNAAREAASFAALHPKADPVSCLKRYKVEPKLVLIEEKNVSDQTYPGEKNIGLTTNANSTLLNKPIQVTVTYTWESYVNIMPDMKS